MPISVSQWQKAGISELYSEPITEAVKNGMDDLIRQLDEAAGSIVSSVRTGQIIIENTAYPFTLAMDLLLNDFVSSPGKNHFTYSTMRLTYSFFYHDYTKTCRVRGVCAKEGVYSGILDGGCGTGNTKGKAEDLLKNIFIGQLSEQMKSAARELLRFQIKPIHIGMKQTL